jgi:hypothetical protein
MLACLVGSLSSQSDDVFSDQQAAPVSTGQAISSQMNSQMSQLKLQQLQQSGERESYKNNPFNGRAAIVSH